MNREIKFRAWDKESKKFSLFPQEYKVKDINYYTDYEWMQYIGLKDKNGKEIFEGDILTSEQYPFQDDGELNYNAEVFWSEGVLAWCYQLHCVNPKKRGISDGICETFSDRGALFEIIGNIYENPELLGDNNE